MNDARQWHGVHRSFVLSEALFRLFLVRKYLLNTSGASIAQRLHILNVQNHSEKITITQGPSQSFREECLLLFGIDDSRGRKASLKR